MNARHLIAWLGSVVLTTAVCRGAEALLAAPTPPALEFRHFPDRLHAFVWRNWETTSLERMAEVLNTTPQNVLEIGYRLIERPSEQAQLVGIAGFRNGGQQWRYTKTVRKSGFST
jgi:hypothetical protein